MLPIAFLLLLVAAVYHVLGTVVVFEPALRDY
jgi:hypothetical protein